MKNNNKGFTLIELMVVIAIIAILTAVILSSIYGSRGKARDAKRISDIAQIQLALEQYFDRNQSYPPALSTLTSSPIYISVLPKDPSTKLDYDYKTDSSSNLDYVLHATLENPGNSAISDGLSTDPYTGRVPSIICAPTVKDYCVGPK